MAISSARNGIPENAAGTSLAVGNRRGGRTYVGDRLSAEQVGKVISKIGRRSKIIVDEGNPRTGSPEKYASAHDLRRTFCQRLADSNLPPDLVRKLMRHADLRTTERYYQIVNTQKDAGKIRTLLNGNDDSVALEEIVEV